MIEENITFRTDGTALQGQLFMPDSQGNLPFVCLCHGIPAKPYDPSDKGYEHIAKKFVMEGFAAFIFNFRGAGRSEGDFDIMGWTRDLQAACNIIYEHPGIDRSRFAVLGSSAGGAVAVYCTARDRRITHLITLACPASFGFITDRSKSDQFLAGCRQVGIIKNKDFPGDRELWLKGFEEVSPIRWIEQVSPRPLLLIHGTSDELIPAEDARRLFDRAGQPREIVYIPEGGHRLRTDPRAMAISIEWLKKKLL